MSPPAVTIAVDSREQAPLPITRLPAVRATLQTGDYSVAGAEHLFSVGGRFVEG